MVSNVKWAAVLGAVLLNLSCKEESGFGNRPPGISDIAATDGQDKEAIDKNKSVPEMPAQPAVEESVKPRLPVEVANTLTDSYKMALKVDVVVAVDTSVGTDNMVLMAQNNLQKIISVMNESKVDANVHLLMDQQIIYPAGTDPNKVAWVREGVDNNNAISRLNSLFAGSYAESYRSINNVQMAAPIEFRKDARLEVLVISDDNARGDGNLAADFDPNKTLKATFNGIVGLPSTVPNNLCSMSNIGAEYVNLAQQSGGSMLDLCAADWSTMVSRLTSDMVKRAATYPLSKKPADVKSIQVSLDKQKLGPEDWIFDDKTNVITLLKTQGVKEGSELNVSYSPAPAS